MNRIAFCLLLSASSLFFQTLSNEELNIRVVDLLLVFASDVTDLSNLDFANARAVGMSGQWQELKRGRGKSKHPLYGSVEVRLRWKYPLDDQHFVVDYDWEWIAASSSHSNIVQVFELRAGKVSITQQIVIDTHHGGREVGAWFNVKTNRLTAKGVNYAHTEGRCCPSLMGIVTFRWDGKRFLRISAKRVPLPKDD